jgi:hypothetical protein
MQQWVRNDAQYWERGTADGFWRVMNAQELCKGKADRAKTLLESAVMASSPAYCPCISCQCVRSFDRRVLCNGKVLVLKQAFNTAAEAPAPR